MNRVINKPLNSENIALFKEAVQFCCDPSNNAVLAEYQDRYVVREKRPEEKEEPEQQFDIPETEIEIMPKKALVDRLDNIENALIELAGIIAGE